MWKMTTTSHAHSSPSPQHGRSRSRPGGGAERDSSRPANMLEFNQAMQDFKHMFPSMEDEVIEAVLRSNNGAVDETIDQLLTMSIDFDEEDNATMPARKQEKRELFHPELLQMSSDEDIPNTPPPPPPTSNSRWDPPSYFDCVPEAEQTDPSSNLLGTFDLELLASPKRGPRRGYINPGMNSNAESSNASQMPCNILDMDLSQMSQLPEAPPLPPKSKPHTQQAREASPHGSPRKTLPPEYSPRHRPKPTSPARHGGHSLTLSSASFHERSASPMGQQNLPRRSLSSVGAAATVPLRSTKRWRPPLLGRLPDDFLRIDSSPSNSRNSSPLHSRSARSSSRSPVPTMAPVVRSSHSSGSPSRISPTMLRKQMRDNVRRQSQSHTLSSAELQCLKDERLALMMQNKEFLEALKEDQDFMHTLEKDRMNATAFEPRATANNDKPVFDPDRPSDDQIEGYGDDRDQQLGIFPFDAEATTAPSDEHAEFKRQLSHMGKTSKKKKVPTATLR